MKLTIGILLAIIAQTSMAESLYAGNKSGGQIVITNRDCYTNGKKYKGLGAAYARTSEGLTINGCWTMQDDMVKVVYNDGTEYSYPAEAFKKEIQSTSEPEL